MRTIKKYTTTTFTDFSLFLPTNSDIVLVGCEGHDDILCLWVLVNTGHRKEQRTFKVIRTDGLIPADYVHVWTFQRMQNMFTWHLLEKVIIVE